MLKYIDAEEEQTELLRDILISSKGHWGYSQEQLDIWRSNLKFENTYVAGNTVKLIQRDTEVIGFFAIVKGKYDEPNELDHLWLLPKVIGKGYGNQVFKRIELECRALGINDFYITSDPDAESFYLKKGAIKVGEVYSDSQKRYLPKLIYTVAASN